MLTTCDLGSQRYGSADLNSQPNTLGRGAAGLDATISAVPRTRLCVEAGVAPAVANAGEQFLRELGLGFRAKYVIPAAEVVASGELDLAALRQASYEDARAALVGLIGVGEKIADCVLAFSLDKAEAFPVDRHIRRALERWYGLPEGMNNSKASEFARARFGQFGAVAQQYMFHRERLAQRAKWGGAHIAQALPEDRM